MGSPFVGEIRMFGGNFAPAGWAFCEGQLMAISENETLFNLIGTTYGGDGQSTFGMPDLRGRIPVHQGNAFIIGGAGGVETVTLTANQMPTHGHPAQASADQGTQGNPAGNVLSNSQGAKPYIEDVPTGAMSPGSIGPAGGSQPHDNLSPFLCVSFIISLFGIFPPRN